MPEGEAKLCLKQFILPFEPKKHQCLLGLNFNDDEAIMDL